MGNWIISMAAVAMAAALALTDAHPVPPRPEKLPAPKVCGPECECEPCECKPCLCGAVAEAEPKPEPKMHEKDWAYLVAPALGFDGVEVRAYNGTRVDLLNSLYACEVDYAEKWAEGVGQAQYYAKVWERRPMLLLLCDSPEDDAKYIDRALISGASSPCGFGIRVVAFDITARKFLPIGVEGERLKDVDVDKPPGDKVLPRVDDCCGKTAIVSR